MTIKFKHAYKSFGKKIIFKDASININQNNIYFIMAPNGSGKTTFFKIITNLQTLDKGKVYNDCSNRKQFSIFDDLSLYKNLTGYQNIQFFTNFKFNKFEIEQYSKKYEMLSKLNQKVSTYSLGEGKKISLLLWELLNPDLVIMDEVTNGLDHNTLKELKSSLLKAKKDSIIILTGHELLFYEEIIDELYILNNGKLLKKLDWKEEGLAKTYEKYF
ncbi:ATP-binding cassette domain-containing protein [Lactococcus lactis]|uniref:ATP-binding cassette domain-containing protein n=1 Tax=Lactococcus lactis TaxID=1358 RepID=UPI0021A4D257|nr:ATP-binding cassette domain-containing protein [Lactococcus lactis]MCT3137900.1 ABC transporter ATP-binding protein [Lactococcus lactis]